MKVRWQNSVVVTLFAYKHFSLNMNPRQLFIARTPFVCIWYFLKQIFRQISSTASLEVVSPKDFEPNLCAAMDEVQLLRVDVDMRFMPGSHRRRPPSEVCTQSSQCHRRIIVTTSMSQRCFANDHGNTSFYHDLNGTRTYLFIFLLEFELFCGSPFVNQLIIFCRYKYWRVFYVFW